MEAINEFWIRFLLRTNRDEQTKYLDVFHFGLNEYLANKLLQLVLDGKKRATSSSLRAWQVEGKLPQVGDLSIVTDWKGEPHCIIETREVTVLPFKDITFEICKREGEDDTLESWQKGHITYFKEEGKELGYEFFDELMVVFEDFEVIYQE